MHGVAADDLPPAIDAVTKASEGVRDVSHGVRAVPGNVGRGVVAGARGVGDTIGGAAGVAARTTQTALNTLLQKKQKALAEKEAMLEELYGDAHHHMDDLQVLGRNGIVRNGTPSPDEKPSARTRNGTPQ